MHFMKYSVQNGSVKMLHKICFLSLQDIVSGLLVLDSKSEIRHDGITLTMEGVISLQLSPKSAGLIESIVNSSKVILFPLFYHIVSKFVKVLKRCYYFRR